MTYIKHTAKIRKSNTSKHIECQGKTLYQTEDRTNKRIRSSLWHVRPPAVPELQIYYRFNGMDSTRPGARCVERLMRVVYLLKRDIFLIRKILHSYETGIAQHFFI